MLLLLEPPDGGVAEHVAQLALRLGRHGWQPEVAGPAELGIADRLESAGIPLHRVPFSRHYGDLQREASVFSALVRLLTRRSYDIVHCHSAKAGAIGRPAAWAADRPAIYSPHSLPFVGPFSAKRRLGARAAERALAPLSRRIICVSEHEGRAAAAAGLGGCGRLRVIPNGCPTCDDVTPVNEILRALGEGGPVVGAVAVLRRQKRLDLLLEAAPSILKRVPDARIAIVGNGPLAGDLAQQAASLGLTSDRRFAFVPFDAAASSYLRALNVFVLPSDWEGLPIAILEALACGVPQVVTWVGGNPEAVTGDTGILVPPGDPARLSDAIASLLEDAVVRARMSAASIARHESRFTVDRMVAGTASVYDECVTAS
ncbi:MAG: glycosyltransferase [Actinomycetota bacterium]|nr:glycosyltransferase [Actinomycetota bacterium]